MTTHETFEQFIQSGLYLRNWSPKTAFIYRRSWRGIEEALGGPPAEFPSKSELERWIVWMRQKQYSPGGINICIRAVNSLYSWLKEQGHITQTIRLKQFKYHPNPITVFSEAEIKALVSKKPKRLTYLRTWIMIVLMLDTGSRIDEVLNLQKGDLDFDNLLVTVKGKGSKVRRIPFSPEMRKHLWAYTQKVSGVYVFGTRNRTKITYRNAYRGIKQCFLAVGVSGAHVHPHNLRHTFACNYIKRNGNIFTLSRLLGHASVSTTQTYLRGLQVEELKHHSPIWS